jgi:hypothetical protein
MPKGGGGGKAKDRAREREAVIGLALAQLPNEDEVRRSWSTEHDQCFPDLDQSLGTLGDLTGTGKRRSHRTLALHLLTKVAGNRGTSVLADAEDGLHKYVAASVEEAGQLTVKRAADPAYRPRPDRGRSPFPVARVGGRHRLPSPPPPGGPELRHGDPKVDEVLSGLHAAATKEDPKDTYWRAFAGTAKDPLDLSSDELALPMCSDEEDIVIGGRSSTRVVTWFSSAEPAAAFAHWTDPRRWHLDCSLFYAGMTAQQPIPDDAEDFSATFIEEVELTAGKTLVTPLVFTRTVRPPNLYAVHFALPKGTTTEDILVDSGSLIARYDEDLPEGHRTQLTAEKCIAFADPAMASWPTMCCDLFWTELTITVALGCAQDGN